MEERFEQAGPFPVYVPRPTAGLLATVVPSSAIVGFHLPSDPLIVHVFYEGNRYGRDDLRRFADRSKFAAGRCRWMRFDAAGWAREHPGEPPPHAEHGWVAYPTTAETLVPGGDLIEVAEYDDYFGLVVPLGPEEAAILRAWIGPVEDEATDLQATGAEFEQRRATPGD